MAQTWPGAYVIAVSARMPRLRFRLRRRHDVRRGLAHAPSPAAARLASALLLAAISSASFAQDYDKRALDGDELRRLANGELVTRPMRVQRRELQLIGGSSWQVIDATPELVWRALHDVARYPKMLPRVLEAGVVATRSAETDIYIRQGAWPIFTSYYLTLRSAPETRTLDFKLDELRPHGIRAGWGFVRLLPYAQGKTLMALGILADPGRGVFVWFARSLVQRWMLKIPETVKHFLESGGRGLYAVAGGVGAPPAGGKRAGGVVSRSANGG